MHDSTGGAFTLVELLVVIAIIVVLMALLAPALDQAVYHSELVRCSGNIKTLVQGGVLYASGNARRYPTGQPRTTRPGYSPDLLAREDDPGIDLRPVFDKAGIPWQKLLLCPLDGQIDLTSEGNDSDTMVLANYTLFFGWQYNGYSGMNKLGDDLSAPDPHSLTRTGSTIERRFKVLVSDKHLENWPVGSRHSTHPNRLHTANRIRYQNDIPNPETDIGGVLVMGEKYTYSEWRIANRGSPHDLNFGLSDGSVLRLDAVGVDDGRLKSAPPRYGEKTYYGHLWGLRLPQ